MTNLFGEEDGSLWAVLTDVVYKDGTIKAQIVPKGHPGAEEYKPMSHKLKVTPKYYMSIDGKVLSLIRKIPKIFKPTDKRSKNTEYYRASPNYFKPPSFGITVPKGFYDDYDYTKSKTADGKETSKCKPNVRYHRACMETWRPFEEWCHTADPPIPLDDWANTPQSVKNFVLESYYVDHMEGDVFDCHPDRLRYCTPPRNSNYRKDEKPREKNEKKRLAEKSQGKLTS